MSQTGTTYTRNAITSPIQTLIQDLIDAPASVIKADLDATGQSANVIPLYSAAEILAYDTSPTYDSTLQGIISGTNQANVNAGMAANAAYAAIIAAIPEADVSNNISIATSEYVVAHMTSSHILIGLSSGGTSLQNSVLAGLYNPIDNTKNVIKVTSGGTTGTVTANADWQVVTQSFAGLILGNVLSITVNGAPVTPGSAFPVANGQVIVVTLTTPLGADAYIILNGFTKH